MSVNTQGTSGGNVTVGLPRYELIDRHGRRHVETFDSTLAAAACAKIIYPNERQDEDRTGRGWDIQIAGS